MKRELELIVQAYDYALQLSASTANDAWDNYDSRLDDYLAEHPEISRETLDRMVRRYYPRWLNAQKKPPSIPPKA
jgi:hypothetical protein